MFVALDLFSLDNDHLPINSLLQPDGEARYFHQILDHATAERYFLKLMETIDWQQDELLMFGKHIQTKRKVAWYGDAPYSYTYSHKMKRALVWTPELLDLKHNVEENTGETYNSCLLNLYHSGAEGMGWHCDDEPELKALGSIASLSLGAARMFEFQHKISKEKVRILLEKGSLLEMKGLTQVNWRHQLPKSLKVKSARINLTFRTIVQ